MVQPADERILRAKYFDWCSAKVADRFLALTPDQIYELAHPLPRSGALGAAAVTPGAREGDPPAAPPSSSPSTRIDSAPPSDEGDEGAEPGYAALVARVTEVLARRLNLPSYEEWLVAYRASPERYEAEMLGLWREADRSDRLSGRA